MVSQNTAAMNSQPELLQPEHLPPRLPGFCWGWRLLHDDITKEADALHGLHSCKARPAFRAALRRPARVLDPGAGCSAR